MRKDLMPAGYEPKCHWKDCYYGNKLYKTGVCVVYGDWDDNECEEFEGVHDIDELFDDIYRGVKKEE